MTREAIVKMKHIFFGKPTRATLSMDSHKLHMYMCIQEIK
jgi:hypothetical protein